MRFLRTSLGMIGFESDVTEFWACPSVAYHSLIQAPTNQMLSHL